MRSDKAKNTAKVLKEVIKNPLSSERKIAKESWVSKSSVNRAMQEVGQIGAKSEIILEICDLDINLVKKWLIELDRRISDKRELKQIKAKELSDIMRDSAWRYTIFKWNVTDKEWWTKLPAVIQIINPNEENNI